MTLDPVAVAKGAALIRVGLARRAATKNSSRDAASCAPAEVENPALRPGRCAAPGAPAPAGTHPSGPAARRHAGDVAAGAPSPRTQQAAPAMPSKTDGGRITNETQERTA